MPDPTAPTLNPPAPNAGPGEQPQPTPPPSPAPTPGAPATPPTSPEIKPPGSIPQPEAKKPDVPEAYVLKPSQGIEFVPEVVAKFSALAKKHGLTQEGAQELADFQSALIKQASASEEHEFETMKKGWAEETNKLFGARKPEAVVNAARFLDKFGTPELRKFLDETGFGNHPELARALDRAGAAISEDTHVAGNPANSAPSRFGDMSSVYDHPTSKK